MTLALIGLEEPLVTSVGRCARPYARTGPATVCPVTEPSAASEDAAAYIARIRAEIEADAERRRRQEPEIQRCEREIERAWIDVAPPGAAGEQGELLLDRADRLSMIDVDAPLGVKPVCVR